MVNKRQTGEKAASAAGEVLSNPKSTKVAKAAAASALAQAPRKNSRPRRSDACVRRWTLPGAAQAALKHQRTSPRRAEADPSASG